MIWNEYSNMQIWLALLWNQLSDCIKANFCPDSYQQDKHLTYTMHLYQTKISIFE